MTDEIRTDLREQIEQLRRILEECPEDPGQREAEVLRLRFGLTDGRVHTAEEVAEAFGLSPARVRQIENQAIRKIHPPSHARKIRDFFRDDGKF